MVSDLTPACVVVHPFKTEGNVDGLCDRDDPGLTGWSAYVRLEDANGDLRDIDELGYFPTSEAAMAAAQITADKLGLHIEED